MEYRIALIEGDGIGPEIAMQTVKALKAVERRFGHRFQIEKVLAVGQAVDACGVPLPLESKAVCESCDAVIIGNIGGSKWAGNPLEKKPETALMELRKALKVCTNLRPVTVYPGLEELSPLKLGIIGKGLDILVVRDILGGMLVYDKKTGNGPGGREASDLEYYNEDIIRKSAKLAFQAARGRRGVVSSLDKSNVLASSMLWQQVVTDFGRDYPDIVLKHHLVDNAAMEVIAAPHRFDVILAPNMFGDIISDEISQLAGAAFMLGSAELGEDGKGIFTPNQLHYPDESIICKDVANPIGLIAAMALMLRYSFGLEKEAMAVEEALQRVVKKGYATDDIALDGTRRVGTEEMGDLIAQAIEIQ